MRVLVERERGQWLIRFFRRWGEWAYLVLGVQGLCAEISFPTEWHEERRGWVRLGFGLFRVGISFPWSQLAPDYMQCAGPTYGFVFFADGLHLHWGQGQGKSTDPMAVVGMPWRWRHRDNKHKVLSAPEAHPYAYTLKSGEVQNRTATVQVETRTWVRPWLPFKRVSRYIDVAFDAEVGERSGSWKGGCVGCSYDMLPQETARDALRRMEAERKF